MVGVEGKTLSAVKSTLDREWVPTPGGARFWSRPTLRAMILDDVYKPHTFEELKKLVSPEVTSRLDPAKCYGVWWYNRRRILERRVSEPSENGGVYRRRRKVTEKPREKWIGVPVPDAGLEREVLEAAREAIRDNRKTSNAGHRFWELSGGVSRCAECERSLVTSVSYGRKKAPYFYYVCPQNYEHHWGTCPSTKCHRAKDLEERVWSLVSGLLKDPERLRVGLERAIEEEFRSRGKNPEGQMRAWLDKITEADTERRGFLRLAAKGRMTESELDEALAELEETREIAKKELETLQRSTERAAELERDKDILLERIASTAPKRIDRATPEERHQAYRTLQLSVSVHADGPLEVSGAFTDVLELESTSSSPSVTTNTSWC
jgi:hypothetical protein